ncbi:MAG: 4-alpha-glucanotransferase [Lachnospiraceae bacterium]
MRKSGILLPISSLPSNYGIGTFSKEAFEFIDFLKKSGQSYWQILPLGPTGYGDSPYQSFSTFAGNPYYIDLDELVEKGYITKEDCEKYDGTSDIEYVDYEKIYNTRFQILFLAFKNSKIEKQDAFRKFIKEQDFWLDDYAMFMAIKKKYNGKSFMLWDNDIRLRKKNAMKAIKKELVEDILFYKFIQFIFMKQWFKLKKYANKKGVEIVGDIPIYVAFDSADTWANPELFQLDENGNPIAVAGCPPDAFSKTGQLWGNPLYRWNYHKKTKYAWWMKRMEHCFKLYDVVRIDHFRGFDEYYAIPFKDKTAEFGKWEKGPGYPFFATLKNVLGNQKVIAEDLGYLTQSVIDMVEKTGYPGMKILQFAFDSREESDYLPHNYKKNSIVYTGTHDNNTSVGWYQEINQEDLKYTKTYLDITLDEHVEWKLIRAALSSVSDTAIIPMQDYLGLDARARTNTPSTLGNNWKWRMKEDAITKSLQKKIYKLTKIFGRVYKE